MSWIDAVIIGLVAGYTLLGYYSGVVRRVLGLLILYGAFFVATYLATKASDIILQGKPSMAPVDARIFAYFGALALVVVVVEGMATAYHDLLQISVVALNKLTGLLLGVVTGLAASALTVYLLGAAANPVGGSMDALQLNIREAVNNSLLDRPLLRTVGPLARFLFLPALPGDAQIYFEKG